MTLELPFSFVEKMIKTPEFAHLENYPEFQFTWEHRRIKKNVIVDTSNSRMSLEEFRKLFSILENQIKEGEVLLPYDKFKDSTYRKVVSKLKWFDNIKTDKELRVKTLRDIPKLFEAFFKVNQDIDPIFFIDTNFYGTQPFILKDIKYINATQNSRAYLSISFKGSCFGYASTESKTIESFDSKDLSFMDVLNLVNITLADESMIEEHKEKLKKLDVIKNELGKVYDVDIFRIYSQEFGEVDRDIRYSYINTDENNISKKFVIDYDKIMKSESSGGYGSKKEIATNMVPAYRETEIPYLPYSIIGGYHLELHSWIVADIEDIRPHQFDGKGLMDKLILSKNDKEIINMLIQQSKLKIDDIISGKGGGSFALSIGKPGTGKTLTAEVIAETMELPLYNIQCSQLGLEPEKIEQRFMKCMRLAERWNAVLLVDEADVYVRSRGLDLKHNAIVGAMLRMLEKSNCIMFMTSNIEDIDDAIKSRATAILRYDNPENESLSQIIDILFKQYEINKYFTSIELVKWLETEYGLNPKSISGRDIKQLCKLTKMKITQEERDSTTLEQCVSLFKYIR